MKINYDLLPEHIRGGMKRYLEHGIEPGSFCKSALANNLVHSFNCADMENTHAMASIASWLYNYCPRGAWGNESIVLAWVSKGGFKGQSEV